VGGEKPNAGRAQLFRLFRLNNVRSLIRAQERLRANIGFKIDAFPPPPPPPRGPLMFVMVTFVRHLIHLSSPLHGGGVFRRRTSMITRPHRPRHLHRLGPATRASSCTCRCSAFLRCSNLVLAATCSSVRDWERSAVCLVSWLIGFYF